MPTRYKKPRLAGPQIRGYTSVVSPLIPLAALLAARLAAASIERLPPIETPVSPATPILAQLRLDLAALKAPAAPLELPVSALAVPAQFSVLQKALDSASLPAARRKTSAAQTDALRRVEVADQLLRRYDPEKFAKLPAADQEAALAKIWDNWSARGLVADSAADADPGRALDNLILAGVEDRELTAANKSAFLAAGVLGYPLQDSLWLQRTNITSAIEESNLSYPAGQKWVENKTPQILGTTAEAQALVNTWGEATNRAKRVIDAVRAGKTGASTEAEGKPFEALVRELAAKGDDEALDYLSGLDPTFTAFLLDARKPGYYAYNADETIVDRVMRAKSASGFGVRRIDKPEGDKVHASTYFYRPARVARRLDELAVEKVEAYDEETRKRFAEYAARFGPLARRLSRP
jgi:hypothetical protein